MTCLQQFFAHHQSFGTLSSEGLPSFLLYPMVKRRESLPGGRLCCIFSCFGFFFLFFSLFCFVCHVHRVLGDYKEPSAPPIQRQINRPLVPHLIVLLFCHVRRRSRNRGDRAVRVCTSQPQWWRPPSHSPLHLPPPPPPPSGRQCDTE